MQKEQIYLSWELDAALRKSWPLLLLISVLMFCVMLFGPDPTKESNSNTIPASDTIRITETVMDTIWVHTPEYWSIQQSIMEEDMRRMKKTMEIFHNEE